MTSEDTQRMVEKVESLRMVITGVKIQPTSENLQRVAKMEEKLRRLMEEAKTRQEETRARSTEEPDVTKGKSHPKGGEGRDEVNETCGKGKGKGQYGGKGAQQSVRTMKSADEEQHEWRSEDDDDGGRGARKMRSSKSGSKWRRTWGPVAQTHQAT